MQGNGIVRCGRNGVRRHVPEGNDLNIAHNMQGTNMQGDGLVMRGNTAGWLCSGMAEAPLQPCPADQSPGCGATGGEASWRRMSTNSVCAGGPRALKDSIGFASVKRLSRVSRRMR
jgi:hypothetical protein